MNDLLQSALGWSALKKIVGNYCDYDLYKITKINSSSVETFNYVYTTPCNISMLLEYENKNYYSTQLPFEKVRLDDPIRFFLGQDKKTIENCMGSLCYYKYYMEHTPIYYINKFEIMKLPFEEPEDDWCYELEGIENFYDTIQSLC